MNIGTSETITFNDDLILGHGWMPGITLNLDEMPKTRRAIALMYDQGDYLRMSHPRYFLDHTHLWKSDELPLLPLGVTCPPSHEQGPLRNILYRNIAISFTVPDFMDIFRFIDSDIPYSILVNTSNVDFIAMICLEKPYSEKQLKNMWPLIAHGCANLLARIGMESKTINQFSSELYEDEEYIKFSTDQFLNGCDYDDKHKEFISPVIAPALEPLNPVFDYNEINPHWPEDWSPCYRQAITLTKERVPESAIIDLIDNSRCDASILGKLYEV